MLLIFQDISGRFFSGAVLSASPYRFRLGIPDGGDALEVELRSGQWFTEEGRSLELVCVLGLGPECQPEIVRVYAVAAAS